MVLAFEFNVLIIPLLFFPLFFFVSVCAREVRRLWRSFRANEHLALARRYGPDRQVFLRVGEAALCLRREP